MALQKTSFADYVRVLFIIAAAIVAMIALTAVFGVGQAGPSYDIVPDPAAGLGLPF
jgi:hypothetical protein